MASHEIMGPLSGPVEWHCVSVASRRGRDVSCQVLLLDFPFFFSLGSVGAFCVNWAPSTSSVMAGVGLASESTRRPSFFMGLAIAWDSPACTVWDTGDRHLAVFSTQAPCPTPVSRPQEHLLVEGRKRRETRSRHPSHPRISSSLNYHCRDSRRPPWLDAKREVPLILKSCAEPGSRNRSPHTLQHHTKAKKKPTRMIKGEGSESSGRMQPPLWCARLGRACQGAPEKDMSEKRSPRLSAPPLRGRALISAACQKETPCQSCRREPGNPILCLFPTGPEISSDRDEKKRDRLPQKNAHLGPSRSTLVHERTRFPAPPWGSPPST